MPWPHALDFHWPHVSESLRFEKSCIYQAVWNRTCSIQNWVGCNSKTLHETNFSVGYMVNHDTSFMLYTTKLHCVAQALGFLFGIIRLAFWSQTVTPVTSFQFTLHYHYLEDNCIQNVHLGRYIVCYMVGNFVLRRHFSRTIKHNFRPYNRWYTFPNEKFEYSYPHSNKLFNIC